MLDDAASSDAPRLADPLKARFLLMIGGIAGLHKLYLEQIPEAFVYISTGGLFLLGTLYDSFYISSQVDFYNMLKLGEGEEIKKYKNGRLMANLSRLVPFSIPRFIASVAYAVWLGFLCWTAGSVTFGTSTNDSLVMVSALAAAVTAGVYIIGNCGREVRDLVYMWLGSFSTTFIHLRFIEDHCMRALLFAAVVATWLGNRSARMRTPLHRPFTWKHFIFWTSLFGLLLGVIAVGATCHIFHRRVSAAVPGESSVTTSVGSLLYDRIMNPQRAHRFFKDGPVITYKPSSSFDSKKDKSWWELDLVGRAPAWADMAAVLVVDVIYQEMRVLEKRSKIEPLKWALWRMYLITKFDAPAFISHMDLRSMCTKWRKEQAAAREKTAEHAVYNGSQKGVMMSSPDYSSQNRSHVQVNIYGTTVEALRGRGVDLERLLSSLGCRCIVMDVPELAAEVVEVVSGKNSSSTCSVSGNDVEKQNRKPEEQVEVQSSAPICELTPDSFVDSDLFLEVKGDPDAPSSSIALQPWSTEEGEISQSRLEGEATPVKPEDAKDNNAVPLLRAPRRRTPRLWYSPQDTPEAMKNKKIKLTRMKAKADREFQCRISGCGKILHFKQSCRRQGLDHVRSHFPRKTRRCKICDYAGNTNASVYNHHTSCHPNEFYPGPLATETKEDLEELQHLFHQAFPEIPGIETYMSMIS